jgi:sugar lactone lactonase YvrE
VEPDPARVEYLGHLRSPSDLGRRPGVFERMRYALFGTNEQALLKPIAVATNPAGVLAVADPGIPAVHRFDLERREYRQFGGEDWSWMRSPVGIAVDDEGDIYVSDSIRGSVMVLDERGGLVRELGAGELMRPTGLALDRERGILYVVDTVACKVLAFDRSGRLAGSFGRRGAGPGEFNSPTFVAVAPDGTISVADSLNFRIQRFRPDGGPINSFGLPGDGAGHFARPKGVAADDRGRLYVVDGAFENIQIFEPDGRLLLPFGGPGSGPGQFSLPVGVFLDASNRIWVADSYNRRIQVFRLLPGVP